MLLSNLELSWLDLTYSLLINFSQQQELTSGGSVCQASVWKRVRQLVIRGSLLFVYKGFGHLKTGIAKPKSGIVPPAKHSAEYQDSLGCVMEHKAAKLGKDIS